MNHSPDKEQEWIEKYRTALYQSGSARQPRDGFRSVKKALHSMLSKIRQSVHSESSSRPRRDQEAVTADRRQQVGSPQRGPAKKPPAAERSKVKRAS